MGGGGAAQAQHGAELARLVRNLATIEKVQNQGITADQAKQLAPVLQAVKSADKIPDADAEAKTADIEKILTPAQKTALEAMAPPRGGFGGGGGGGGGAGGGGSMGGPTVNPRTPGGPTMGGGGGRPDPEKPFASDRNKQALDDLLTALPK